MNKNQALLKNFIAYCESHPEERFWQALRNWCGWPFLLVAKNLSDNFNQFEGIEDTFYWEENKNTDL